MSAADARPSALGGTAHPAVLDRRVRELLLLALTALVPTALALAITVELGPTSLVLVVAAIVAVLGVVALMASDRLEVTVAIVAFYLLLLDGPVKLLLGEREETSSLPNVLILAICAGALMRLVVRRQRVTMPPLSSWVLGFVGIVAVEAFNPHTEGILKILAGFREQLEWMPFFFFGYLLMRSKKRFRQLFLILGVAALANGVVSAYQTRLSPAQMASWGPGYYKLIHPIAGTSRVYTSEGEARVRPTGLGSDEGFGAGVGQIALPFCLALLATWRRRRRWLPVLLCLGALLAIITGLGRSQVIGGAISVLAFAALASLAGRHVSRRALGAILTVGLLAIPSVVALTVVLRHGTFSRYESIAGTKVVEAPGYKEGARALLPNELSVNPFGVGLGTSGTTSGVGGKSSYVALQYRAISDETEYNVLANEVGIPGVVMWFAMSVYVMGLAALGVRRVRDDGLALYLAGALAPFLALFIGGFSGALNSSAVAGPYFWFAIGIVAYWFVGPGRMSRLMRGVKPANAMNVGATIPVGA
jgi:hypothetical protein